MTVTTRPYRLRRSCHAVPGASPRMIEKAAGLPADMVFLDLEDSVAPSAKESARAIVAQALRATRFRATTVGLRVNTVESPWCWRDLVEVLGAAGAAVDVVVLPKADDPSHVAFADHLIAGIERENGWEAGRIGLEAQIESAAGLVAVERIAAAAPRRLEALVFGPGDFAASMGMPSTSIGAAVTGYPGDAFHHALARIVTVARAHGLQAVDGPFAGIRDPDGLVRSAALSRALGFDGKWSIHPGQIEALNAAYGVSEEEFARARRILEAYEHAREREGLGAVAHEDEMVDEATRRMAERVWRRGRLAGMPGA